MCWHKLGEVDNEYTWEKPVLSAIIVPKIFTIRRNFAKLCQKISLHSFFWDTVYSDYFTANLLENLTVKVLKIGKYLTTLCAYYGGLLFLAHPVYAIAYCCRLQRWYQILPNFRICVQACFSVGDCICSYNVYLWFKVITRAPIWTLSENLHTVSVASNKCFRRILGAAGEIVLDPYSTTVMLCQCHI